MSRNVLFIVAFLPALLVAYVVCINWSPVPLAGFGAPVNVQEGIIVLTSYLAGLVSIGSLWNAQMRRQVRGGEKLVKWEREDQKLAVEVASDEVKLLKQKIATLDAALASALKKLKERKGS
ncbi:MAG TPA: hypothetical protein V6C81_06505 [Planktothrix sp.]|jgi:uncharacterized integral membrane protein